MNIVERSRLPAAKRVKKASIAPDRSDEKVLPLPERQANYRMISSSFRRNA